MEFVPFLRFDREIWTVICTTNAIESINARLRRAVNARGHFLSVTWNLGPGSGSLRYGLAGNWKEGPCPSSSSRRRMARAGSARGGGRVAADLGRPGTRAPDDRRVCPRAGRVPGRVRAGERRPGHGQPCPRRDVRPRADQQAQPPRAPTSSRSTPERGCRTPRSSSGSSRSACSMTTSSRKACATPTPSEGGSTRLAGSSAAASGVSSRGWSSCRGSPTSGSGPPSCGPLPTSRSATG